ncbi:hypothetical protein EAH80_19020 [Mycobacterium hodleri]|uniref:Alpha/beta hydrolase n=1 Tax=Mycolicibacterium hodleri TaxID=49897 RepID=A0A502E681_9MYCO|nr:hypothetical protein EAH80_19020 [Mycolicibacterium hodleri]
MLTTPPGPKFVKSTDQSGAKSGDHTHASWDYVAIEGASDWVPLEQPERIAALIASWAART